MTIQRAYTVIEILLNHLPDSAYYDDSTWDFAWEELGSDAQDNVKRARAMAMDFLDGSALLDGVEERNATE
jgi:hypothetical protein